MMRGVTAPTRMVMKERRDGLGLSVVQGVKVEQAQPVEVRL